MTPLEPLALFIAVTVAIVGITLTLGVARLIRKPSAEEQFQDKLAELNKSELNDEEREESEGWMAYWNSLYGKTGRVANDPASAGRGVIIIAVLGAVFGLGVFPGGAVGLLIMPIGLIALAKVYFGFEASRRTKTLDKQLPLLLSSLRANLQSNSTPQGALISVSDEIPAPLGDELKILRSELEVNVPLEDALRGLAERVDSREIRFLISSIETAVSSGQDLDPQLETIQQIVEQRTRIRSKLSSAVAEVTPALWVSGLIIPASLLFSFYQSDTNRQFWLSLWGIVAFITVAVLYLAGLFISHRLVKGVENT